MKQLKFFHLLLIAGLLPGISQAQQQDWWFEIEVLIFNRLDSNTTAGESEQFNQKLSNFSHLQSKDLLAPYLKPVISHLRDALPNCQPPKQEVLAEPVLETELPPLPWEQEQQQLAQQLKSTAQMQAEDFLQQSQSWPDISPDLTNIACQFSYEQQLLDDLLNPIPKAENWIEQVPVVIDGIENEYLKQAYLLPKNKLQFKTLYRDIQRNKDKRPLLHIAWRQPVKFGRSKAESYRLYAGDNLAKQFSAEGNLLQENKQQESANPTAGTTTELDIFQQLELALQQPVPEPESLFPLEQQQQLQLQLADLWQLDGLFKVYLQNIGRVPYLHIDSQFQYLTPVMQEQELGLVKAEFKQLRRVISRQIHYFDHPQFGMVVQIRRYKRPTPESDEE